MKRPLPLPEPDEEPELQPVPQEQSQLSPPPRRPPTAIGLIEPGRSPRSGPPIPHRLTRVGRAARIMLGFLLLVAGIATSLASPVGFAVGVAAIFAATNLIARTVRAAA